MLVPAMATSCVRFSAAALALLLLCAVPLTAAHLQLSQIRNASARCNDAPSAGKTDMDDFSAAMAALRQFTPSLEASLAQAEGAQGLEEAERAEGAGRGRSLAAAKVPTSVPKYCPKAGCNCVVIKPTSPCKDWVCCSRANAFNACNFDRELLKRCKRGKAKLYKAQCVQVKTAISLYGKYLSGVGKAAAKRCATIKPFNDILGQVRRDLDAIYKGCC